MTTSITVTLITLSEVSTKDLVAFYNAHNVDKPVAKFADRKTAERRVRAIIEEHERLNALLADAANPVLIEEEASPAIVHKTRKSREVVKAFVSPNADVPEEEITEEQALAELALMKKHQEATKTKTSKTGLTLSAAIAQSWNDPVVAMKRTTRHGVLVTVNGKSAEFKSVRSAFAELNLPDSKHIRFRMSVKEHGSAIFEHNGQSYLFSLFAESAE